MFFSVFFVVFRCFSGPSDGTSCPSEDTSCSPWTAGVHPRTARLLDGLSRCLYAFRVHICYFWSVRTFVLGEIRKNGVKSLLFGCFEAVVDTFDRGYMCMICHVLHVDHSGKVVFEVGGHFGV